jgi:hypothetical protein
MERVKNVQRCVVLGCLALGLAGIFGCSSPDRVYYSGPDLGNSREAVIVKTTAEALRSAGYEKIGTIVSEPQTQSGRFAADTDNQTVLEAIAPENSKELMYYYGTVHEEACKKAAKAGGDVLLLEEIRHTFPPFRPETAVLLGKGVGQDIKSVTSVKVWSVWRKPRTKN